VSDRWRFACPCCDSVSLYARQDGTYRCKQCDKTFAKRYDNKLDRLV
jgi:ribosomal protein L37AE/L43A